MIAPENHGDVKVLAEALSVSPGKTPARQLLEAGQSRDPARAVVGMPPNLGQPAVPHVLTFQGMLSSIAKVYRASDEALKQSLENARFMRNDPMIMECVEQRQRSLALLDWHLEPGDEKDPAQQALVEELTAIIQATPRFMQYRENLAHAVWYGRYGISHRFAWKKIKGKLRVAIDHWTPVNGDKLVFRYDDGSGEHDPNQVGIRVNTTMAAGQHVKGRWLVESLRRSTSVEATDRGLAYFLSPEQRPLLAVHRHYIEDGEFEDPLNAGRVHGVGLRSRLYWVWVQKQELLAWLMEYLERSAFGIEIWYYPWGNDDAKRMTQEAAEKRIGDGRNIILAPKPPGEESMQYGVQRIEPGMAGADTVLKILSEFFGHLMKRYILGQTLTSEAGSTGLGSNLASVHLDTYMQIIRYDATNLEETLTTDLVEPLLAYNFPRMSGCGIKFKIDTEAPDAEAKLNAWKAAYDMGLKIRASDVYELIAAQPPEKGDEVLQQPQQGPQGPGGPGGPGMPPGGFGGGNGPGSPPAPKGPPDDAQQLYGAIQKEGDKADLEKALGVQQSENTERQQVDDDGGEIDGPLPSDKEQLADALPHASGFDAQALGRGLAAEMANIPDVGLALKVAEKKLERDPKAYDVEKYEADGEWITIGGDKSNPQGKRGGVPVKVKDGKIVGGPKSLKGKKLKSLSSGASDSRYETAVRSTSRDHGVNRKQLKQAIDHVWSAMRDAVEEREAGKKLAREKVGITAADYNRLVNSGRDYTSIPHFDATSQELAWELPELGIDPDNAAQSVWELIAEGRQHPPARHDSDVIEAAVKMVRSGQMQEQDAGEVIPFALSGDVEKYGHSGERWITLNGGDGDGTPVKIDNDGDIVAGPRGLAEKGIRKLDDFGSKAPRKAQKPKNGGTSASVTGGDESAPAGEKQKAIDRKDDDARRLQRSHENNDQTLEPKYRLRDPIKGPSGASIVGYKWQSMVQDGMYGDRSVSDWSRSQVSTTGREIVHLFWVRSPDGNETLMGIGAAQKALGMPATRLRTIASQQAASQKTKAQNADRMEKQLLRSAPSTAEAANAEWWRQNNPQRAMWGTPESRQKVYEDNFKAAQLLEKDGKFVRIGDAELVASLKERGWSDTAEPIETAKYSLSAMREAINRAAAETDREPSDDQKKSGNYRKGKVRLHGLEIAIENPRGSTRSGQSKDGKPWSVTMADHYGYIKRTLSDADGDHVDVFIGPHPDSELVVVIDQNTPGGRFDEHKVMLGFKSQQAAIDAYHANYSPGWKGFRHARAMTMDDFKAWLDKGDTGEPIEKAKYSKWSEADHPRDDDGRFSGGLLTEEPVTAGDGVTLRSTSPIDPKDRGESYDTLLFRRDGQHAGKMQYHYDGRTGTAEIDDTVLEPQFRGQGVLQAAWPRFVDHLKALGAKKIVAKVVEEKIGPKVWGKLGFREYGKWDGHISRWELELKDQ